MGGALAPVADHRLGIWGLIGSGVCGSRITCLGPGRKGMEITSGRRDARSLTFSVVIPARAMQPKIEERGNQKWRMALCPCGMAFSLRHRVHLVVQQPFESLAPPRCTPARVIPGRTLWEGEGRVGSRASPQVQSTPFFRRRRPAGGPVPVPPQRQSTQRFLNHVIPCPEGLSACGSCAGWMNVRTAASAGQPLNRLRHHPREQPLNTMGFRLRRSARLGRLRCNCAKGGLRSISVGGPGSHRLQHPCQWPPAASPWATTTLCSRPRACSIPRRRRSSFLRHCTSQR